MNEWMFNNTPAQNKSAIGSEPNGISIKKLKGKY